HERQPRRRELDGLGHGSAGRRRPGRGGYLVRLAHLAHDALDAERDIHLAILEMRALLDAILAAGEDRVVELLDDREERDVLLHREERPGAMPRIGAPLPKARLH